jgi:hypothetical protein
MSTLFAVYVPKIHELTGRLVELGLAWVVLIACARWLRLGKVLPAALMLVGCILAVLPGFTAAASEDLGDYGNICRQWNNTNLSDGFFAVVTYFHVGWGTILGFAGMLVPFCFLAIVMKVRELRRANRFLSNDSADIPGSIDSAVSEGLQKRTL